MNHKSRSHAVALNNIRLEIVIGAVYTLEDNGLLEASRINAVSEWGINFALGSVDVHIDAMVRLVVVNRA